MNKLLKQAFTLIELLVVIAIIGILSGLIVISMGGVTQKANIAKAQVFSNSLRNALMMNIVSEWKFDELSSAVDGTVIQDSWGGVNNGILYTGADPAVNKLSTDCVSGKCLTFDGSDDFINCGTGINSSLGTSFTFSIWIKPKTYDSERFIMAKGSQRPALDYYLSRFVWTVSGGSSYLYSTTYPVQDNWYYLVGTYDGTTSKIYVNGNLENSVVISSSSDSNPLYIGWYYSGAGRYLKGSIDDARIYNAAIPVSQIKEQYYAGLNSLLVSGQIDTKEYIQKINSIANE